MSMVVCLVTLYDANIQRLLADPPLVWRVIAPDDPDIYAMARSEGARRGLLGRLFGRARTRNSGEEAPDIEMADGEGLSTDLDKSWHGIHYLLTGAAWEGGHPENFLVTGGREVGDIDVGYGPARVLTAAEAHEVGAMLEAISDEQLRQRFNPQDMLAKKIYPEIWSRPPDEDDSLEYVMDHVGILRQFVRDAVKHELGFVVYCA